MGSDEAPIMGLLGAGGIARAHLPALLSLGLRVLVFSEDGREDALIADCGGGERATKAELLDRCDIVDVCTPTFTHRGLVLECAAAGKDIICEKPLGLTPAEAIEMRDACRRAGVALHPAHVVRYFGAYRTARTAVERGEIGRVAVQRFVRGGARPKSSWFADEGLSGGIILDQMIHDLDFSLWSAGPVATVFARHVDRGPGSVCAAHVVMTHRTGALTTVTGYWGAEGIAFRTSFEVVGTAGLASHDSATESSFRADVPAGARAGGGLLPSVSLEENPYRRELADFLNAIRRGSDATVTVDDGVSAVQLAWYAQESARTGRALTVTREEAA
ncbi:Gfo/Idh/MocA family oxidoreductase [Microbacterium betulae]|uniref:Gfo/Idh/MocA family oxidoreductase n=1 Tax=Microbacterium betulae TaxID=2981139 RepID=A0AA97FHB6_9MICO|nr:Gfo/Idh/MocA family oxidoreductase [Microbacterium sp. AB]WOF23183.1 Gfo/Idh/MocA family oxidoreductase [Microbacterium sp. AB]